MLLMRRRCMLSLVFAAFSMFLPQTATLACLHDRDSDALAQESGELPDLMRVITGRFERNPPLFYEMRLARVAREIQSSPGNLSLYDDAAVACDRLGRQDEAIAWMKKKRARMEKLAPRAEALLRAPELKEHWYRYHANIGTFQAHRWIKSGGDRTRMADMEAARENIRQALKINPKAHFGREMYQADAIVWIIEGKPGAPLTRRVGHGRDPVGGLSGLVVLGNAWESADVFHAISELLNRPYRGTSKSNLSYLAELRVGELIDNGRGSLMPGAPRGQALKEKWGIGTVEQQRTPDSPAVDTEAIAQTYRQLRAEAEDWHQRRTAFMLARLKAGRHPDTDPDFWNGWKDDGPPRLSGDGIEQPLYEETEEQIGVTGMRFLYGGIVFAICMVLTPLVLLYLRKRRRSA